MKGTTFNFFFITSVQCVYNASTVSADFSPKVKRSFIIFKRLEGYLNEKEQADPVCQRIMSMG